MKRSVILLTLVLIFAQTTYAGPKGKKYGIHTIHGKNYDRGAIEKLLDESDEPANVYAGENGISELEGKFRLDRNKPVEEAAVNFIDRHRHAFKLKEPKKELKLQNKNEDKWGLTDIHYQQTCNGVPIWGKVISVHIDRENDISSVGANLVPTPDFDTTPLITEEEAVRIAREDLQIPHGRRILPPKTKLVIFHNILVYEVGIETWRYFINAKDGDIVSKGDVVVYD